MEKRVLNTNEISTEENQGKQPPHEDPARSDRCSGDIILSTPVIAAIKGLLSILIAYPDTCGRGV